MADVYMLGAFVGFVLLGESNAVGPASGCPSSSVWPGTGSQPRLWSDTSSMVLARLGRSRERLARSLRGRNIPGDQNGALTFGSAPVAYPLTCPKTPEKSSVSLAVCLILLFATEIWVRTTKFGAAMRAVGIDHGAVRLMGIRVENVLYVTFAAFSAIAGITGYLAGSYYGSIQFSMASSWPQGVHRGGLGGIGNVRGALVGGWVLGLVEAFGGGWLGTEWTNVIAFAFLIAVLVFSRPEFWRDRRRAECRAALTMRYSGHIVWGGPASSCGVRAIFLRTMPIG